MMKVYKVTEVEVLSSKVLRRVHYFHGPDEAYIYKVRMERPGKMVTIREEIREAA